MFLATGAFAQQQQQPISPSTQPPAPNASRKASRRIRTRFKSQVSLVVLHASVLNDRSVFVPGLKEENFRVFEDKVEQKLSVFKQEDVPVSFGLVMDNSGSMRDKRPQVNAAALTFVKTSNPQDEGFVVNFNDDYYLDTEHDFTSDLDEMKTALERIDARGSTALYDAVIGSLDHLKKGTRDKKVILVVTDGEDNASRHSLENTVEQAQRNDAVIYAVGLFSDDDMKHNKRAMKKARERLSELANATGGLAFFPEDAERHRSHLHADCPRHPQPIHSGVLSDEHGPRRLLPDRAGRSHPSARNGKAQRAHAHGILRAACAVFGELIHRQSNVDRCHSEGRLYRPEQSLRIIAARRKIPRPLPRTRNDNPGEISNRNMD